MVKKLLCKQSVQRSAFTMIELVFVIVVLGILAGVAIPKLVVTRDDAMLVKGKSQVASIRSGIALQKSKRMLEGTTPFIPTALDNVAGRLFNYSDGNTSNILEYPIFSEANRDGAWVKTNTENTYEFRVMGVAHTFFYDKATGTFNCTAGTYCNELTR